MGVPLRGAVCTRPLGQLEPSIDSLPVLNQSFPEGSSPQAEGTEWAPSVRHPRLVTHALLGPAVNHSLPQTQASVLWVTAWEEAGEKGQGH